VASFSRNFGHQIALTAGLDFAAGDAVIMMDSDLQHPPALIPELIRRWREGHDIVSAVRDDTEGVSIFKKASSRAFYWLINALSAVPIPEGAAARAAGESKHTLFKMVGLALDAIVPFSTVPIRLATRVGFLITALGFVYLAWNLIRAFLIGQMAPGWVSLIAVTMILGGAQLIFIGLIGQYAARMFAELKGRLMYILKQEPPPPARSHPRRSRLALLEVEHPLVRLAAGIGRGLRLPDRMTARQPPAR